MPERLAADPFNFEAQELAVLDDITEENVLQIEGLQRMDWEADILSGKFGEAAYQKLQASLNSGEPLYGMPATPELMITDLIGLGPEDYFLNKYGTDFAFIFADEQLT